MADIELVIKIPEEHFKKICANKEDSIIAHDTCRRIANGTPIPEHHGDLIDKNEITAFAELECNGHDVKSLDEFTTIIPATKEGDGE